VTEQRQIAEPNATPAVTEQRQVAESNPTPTVTEQLQVAGSNPTPAVTEQHRVEEPTLGPAGTEQLQVAASNPTPLVTEQPRVAQPRPVSAMKDQVQVEKPKSAPTGRTAPVPATPPPAAVSPVKQAPPPRAAGGNNRASFLDALTRVLTARPAKSAYRAVLYIELDKETLHAARWGDRATEQFMGDVEKRLRETLTAPYLVARHDAFVFVALINHRERQGLAKTAQGVKQAIEGGVFAVGGETVRVQCTMGVCFIDPRMRRAAGVIDHAKSACRKAREAGGRRIAFSGLSGTPSARAPQPENSDPEVVRLRKALAEDRFRLVFQPVVHFHAAPTETYEILLRMVDEKGWEIMPSEFIPKAEACGLMQEIDRWVVKTAVTALQERRQSGNDTRLFVKLSDVSIDSPDFLPWLQELLQIMPQQRDGLIFQFSEPMLAQRMDRALKFIHDLTALGCGTALDHFGMDKDSLSLAKKLPVNYLKIHGNLIQRLVQDISSQRLLKDIVDVAQTHGQVTIATFVQDPQILSILWRSRVDYVQGFYFQPPKPAMAYDFTSATS
jgi:EAL domain-containing protein (putative c-di-GMP-specific phosphodiesterase class I)/GGDEF domain-containing protein